MRGEALLRFFTRCPCGGNVPAVRDPRDRQTFHVDCHHCGKSGSVLVNESECRRLDEEAAKRLDVNPQNEGD